MYKFEFTLTSKTKLPINWIHSLTYNLAKNLSESSLWHSAYPSIFSSGLFITNKDLYRGYLSTTEQNLVNLIMSPGGLVPGLAHQVPEGLSVRIASLKMSDFTSFEHILERNKDSTDAFILNFLTPCFIKRGEYYDRLPNMGRIISSVYREWLARGGPSIIPCNTLVSWVNEYTVTSNCNIETTKKSYKNNVFAGITGTMKIAFTNNNDEFKNFVLALLDFASLFGIGSKTALGFGWVELSKERGQF